MNLAAFISEENSEHGQLYLSPVSCPGARGGLPHSLQLSHFESE
jgi:hypothetical protein